MNWFFFEFSPAYPYLSSALKFLVLGTLGEWLGGVLATRGAWLPFSAWKFLPKLAIWALLGICVKWGFSSFAFLVEVQAQRGYLPAMVLEGHPVLRAFITSVELNVFFGPAFMYLHRVLDNVVDRKWNYHGMQIAIFALGWFWIPAHTLTFSLPENFRVIAASIFGVCLGVILGFAKRAK